MGRVYKPQKKKSSFLFILLCATAVIAVALISALAARIFRPDEPLSSVEDVTTTIYETATAEAEKTEEVPASTTENTEEIIETTVHTREIELYIDTDDLSPEAELYRLFEGGIPSVIHTVEVTESLEVTEETTAETTKEPVYETTEFDGEVALYYKDMTSGDTLVYNKDRIFFAASMIKAVYVYTLLESADRGEIDIEGTLTYDIEQYVEGSGNFDKVEDGTEFEIKELISLAIRFSDNTAFDMIKKHFGEEIFTAVLTEKGLSRKYFGYWWRTDVVDYGEFFTLLYEYFEGGSENANWLMDLMCRSTQAMMLQRALAPEKVAHKYGWDEFSYCDGAVVLNEEHPYILVFMSNLDEGHLKHENTKFIYEIGRLISKMHNAKYEESND